MTCRTFFATRRRSFVPSERSIVPGPWINVPGPTFSRTHAGAPAALPNPLSHFQKKCSRREGFARASSFHKSPSFTQRWDEDGWNTVLVIPPCRGEVRVILRPHNEPPDPIHIRLLRAGRHLFEPQHLSALVQETQLGIGHQTGQRTTRKRRAKRNTHARPNMTCQTQRPKAKCLRYAEGKAKSSRANPNPRLAEYLLHDAWARVGWTGKKRFSAVGINVR